LAIDDNDIPVLTDSLDIPVLTEAADLALASSPTSMLNEHQINELRIRLIDSAHGLMERLLYNAIREMENALLEDLANHLRDELPEIIDTILQEHLGKPVQGTGEPD
jgi:hypothetical protein|tara:strand:- start:201 stop:521 length:321 start_codon:yes stop_codon:yes gene_type:complete